MAAGSAGTGLKADLVLEGGGVKGIGLVGAVTRLAEAGYGFPRIAGSSAGAIVGSVLAAMQRAGEPTHRLVDIVRTLDYKKFRDRGRFGWALNMLGPVGDLLSLLLENGLYEGDYLRAWLASTLRALGVEKFGDLRLPEDPDSDIPEGHRYRLVVMASDVSRQRLVRLPWDYAEVYGLDPDEQPVADAVRASASIPFFFEPLTLRSGKDRGVSTLVDGGVLSNYPIAVFDRTDGKPPRWPTFGIRLSARDGEQARVTRPATGPVSLGLKVVETMIGAADAAHIHTPCALARSVFVDTSGISAVDFDITPAQQDGLLAAGREAAERFLAGWDFDRYRAVCRGGAQ
ncbi:hypothetical protein C3Y87_10440 [Carbonactinospora thermoautotrophica]|nr:patatin-like phospholipase family protein [Carbonactinospora thermoautotrophica]KWX04015.1 hypothetical protein TH66_08665 [Carbonactinospora thermoautotrophica]MCX9191825.1 hypothetical protein [Carbonactinospora thermoautotrophica]